MVNWRDGTKTNCARKIFTPDRIHVQISQQFCPKLMLFQAIGDAEFKYPTDPRLISEIPTGYKQISTHSRGKGQPQE